MDWMLYLAGVLFVLTGMFCVVLSIVGLPGTWLMILLAVVVDLVDSFYLSSNLRPTFSWQVLIVCGVLGLIGEILEFFATGIGAKKAGASGRGMFGSFIGAMVGVVAGTFLIPIPVLGSIAGAVAGAAGGAILGELTHEDKEFKDTIKPATGAMVGRLMGTLSKLPIAIIVWLILSVAVFWP
ncbi:MAG: hypothetical protein CMJ32_00225 [Phycisphaerae bacterium]|nr:hypothetical protein [Phycisphaerae bacterium]